MYSALALYMAGLGMHDTHTQVSVGLFANGCNASVTDTPAT